MSSSEFTTSEGLRRLLIRLNYSGPNAWRNDPEAEELMSYCGTKYGGLARKHHVEPDDAVAAAFEAMRTWSVRVGEDPWAVATRAVQITLIAAERGDGLLCSTDRARRPEFSVHHDAERFSDRETPIYNYHPSFQVPAAQDDVEIETAEKPEEAEPTNAFMALEIVQRIFVALGWPENTAAAALNYIAARLIESGDRRPAYEMLRRDHHARVFLDLSRPAWLTVLRVVLGNQIPDFEHTSEGRGLLLRLAIGHTPAELLEDDDLVRAISEAAPPPLRTVVREPSSHA